MKRLMLSVFCCLVLLLPSCRSPQAPSGAAVRQEADSASVSVRLVTGPYGPDLAAASAQGYYRYVSDSTNVERGGNILYTDFAACAEVALCSRPDCTHRDESCTSWLPFWSGELFLSADESALFCIGDAGGGDELWRMNPDGSEKTMLYRCESGEDFTGAVASDVENLYASLSAVGGMERLADTKTVLRIDSVSGACEKLFELDSNEWIQGAFDDQLVVKSVEPEAAVRYALYSLSTGERTEIYSFEGESQSLPEGAFLYVLAKSGKEQADVLRVNLRTGEAATLCTGFPFFGWVMMDDVRDGKLRVSVSDTRANDPALVEHYLYWIDCETGEVTQTTLTYPWVETAQFVQVLAEYEDSFLVQRGIEYTPIMLTGTDGTAYETTSETPVYAMIAKSNYFANNPVYQDVAPSLLPGA